MQKSFRENRLKKIYTMQEETHAGWFYDLALDLNNGRINALIVKQLDVIFPKTKIILIKDIIKWIDNIYIQNIDFLSEIDEIIRLKNLKDSHFCLINIPVITEEGLKVGFVRDYYFSIENEKITKILVGKQITLLNMYSFENYIEIKTKDIIKISKERIIVKDLKKLETEETKEPDYIPSPSFQ
jgi:sporulation protein YlmC with PRC-barrel domain